MIIRDPRLRGDDSKEPISSFYESINISPSRLMMPLGYAAIFGGALTLISTTPNLIFGSELERLSRGDRPLKMFDFAIVGIPISVVGIVYMALIGTKLLGRRGSDDVLKKKRFNDRVLKRYQPQREIYKLAVSKGSGLADSTIAQASLGKRCQIEVVQISRTKGIWDHSRTFRRI